jgi:Rod binding domain-containing protein
MNVGGAGPDPIARAAELAAIRAEQRSGMAASAPGGGDRLKETTREFEAVFMQEMLKAMRDTVPESGLLDGGRSEEIFTAMLDEHVARLSAGRSEGGLGAALYRRFGGRVGG